MLEIPHGDDDEDGCGGENAENDVLDTANSELEVKEKVVDVVVFGAERHFLL